MSSFEEALNATLSKQRDVLQGELREWENHDLERGVHLDWLTSLAGCGPPEYWFNDDGVEDEDCKIVQRWNRWQQKWMMEYSRDGVEKPEDWCALADMLDERYDSLEASASDWHESDKEKIDEQREEIAALTRKNLEMTAKIEEQERLLQEEKQKNREIWASFNTVCPDQPNIVSEFEGTEAPRGGRW